MAMMTVQDTLSEALIQRIREEGPIPVADYMEAANGHYYASHDPFGVQGDFITSPEISQMFGEMIGIWFADLWTRSKVHDVHYVELGPGRGTLAADAAGIPVPDKVVLKRPQDFKLIGKPVKRLDTPAKVNGTAVYGIDVRPPGVKVATLAQSPAFGGRVKSVDDKAAKAVKGVHQIVRLDDAVAVVRPRIVERDEHAEQGVFDQVRERAAGVGDVGQHVAARPPRQRGRRAAVPSSFNTSQITPAGLRPARRARSTAVSVWPTRCSTPPSRARNGKT